MLLKNTYQLFGLPDYSFTSSLSKYTKTKDIVLLFFTHCIIYLSISIIYIIYREEWITAIEKLSVKLQSESGKTAVSSSVPSSEKKV